MKIYIAGKITGLENYKELFLKLEEKLTSEGHFVMNPSVLPFGFEHHEYMHVCKAMIDVCDSVRFLSNWKDSKGAVMEFEYALLKNKVIQYDHNIKAV